MGKYNALESHLSSLGNGIHTMSFSEIEQIIGGLLPESAKKQTWWNSHIKPLSDNQEVKQITLDDSNGFVTFEVSSLVNEYEHYRTSLIEFNQRWGIESNDSFENFMARVLLEFGDVLNVLSYKKDFCFPFFSIIGIYPKIIRKSMFDQDQYNLFDTFKNSKNILEVVRYIQVSLDVLDQLQFAEWIRFKEAVHRVVGISLNPPFLIHTDETTGSIHLLRAGAKLLDDKVINADLHWLTQYPKVESNFHQALILYQGFDGSDNQARVIYDQLRVSLETLFQAILENSKTLDNNKGGICEWLKSKGTHPNVVNIFGHLITQFDKFMNDPKHGRDYKPNDLEFMVYLTGILMWAILEKNRT